MSRFQSEIIKIDTVDGNCEYPEYLKGFFLNTSPGEGAENQGSGAGSKYSEVTFFILGDRTHADILTGLCGNNVKKPTFIQHTSVLTIDGKRKELGGTKYEELTFQRVRGSWSAGDEIGLIELFVHYSKKHRQSKGFKKDGRAGPTTNLKVDLNKGKLTAT